MKSYTTHEGLNGFYHIQNEMLPWSPAKVKLVRESGLGGPPNSKRFPLGNRYLWIGENIHLNQDQVREFIAILKHWIDKGRLPGANKPVDLTPEVKLSTQD